MLVLAFAALRLVCANFRYFWEGDDVSIATGIVALVRGVDSHFYRYGPQVGYYRLVQWIALALGGDPSRVPLIMIILSAISGAIVPVAALCSFRRELTFGERLLLCFVLLMNPILWISSQYGNTAMVSLAFAVGSVWILSNRPRPVPEAVALALFGIAVVVRADAILMFPLLVVLGYRNHKRWAPVIRRGTGVAAALAVTYGLLFCFEPRMAGAGGVFREHFFDPHHRTMFWEYLIWAFSPVPLLYAAWGLRDLITGRARMLPIVAAWSLPVFAFYFCKTTTPRYFLLTIFPLSLCTVVGMSQITQVLAVRFRRRVVWAAVLGLCCVHLFVGLGNFSPDRLSNVVRDARILTHDGPMLTGALLPKALFEYGFLGRSLRSRGFGKSHEWAPSIEAILYNLMTNKDPAKKIIVLLPPGERDQFYYHAQVAGAVTFYRAPGRAFATETWMRLGETEVMIIAFWAGDYDALEEFRVGVGDELWVKDDRMESTMVGKLPANHVAVPIEGPGAGFRAYAIARDD